MRGLTLGEDLLLYVRSSDREQVTSCDEQITVAVADCVAAGVLPSSRRLPRVHTPAAGVYVDEFTSAWKKRPDERPACRELLAFCEANPGTREHPRYIWLWELSRFLRAKGGGLDASQWIERLRGYGWYLLSHVEGPFLITRANRFHVGMQLLMHTERATSESETREDRGFRGKGDRFARGVWPAGEAPFGYERWAVRVSFDEHTLQPLGASSGSNGCQSASGMHTTAASRFYDRARTRSGLVA
jgi:DNA invertase Pin-like site-specific DNA recombinase